VCVLTGAFLSVSSLGAAHKLIQTDRTARVNGRSQFYSEKNASICSERHRSDRPTQHSKGLKEGVRARHRSPGPQSLSRSLSNSGTTSPLSTSMAYLPLHAVHWTSMVSAAASICSTAMCTMYPVFGHRNVNCATTNSLPNGEHRFRGCVLALFESVAAVTSPATAVVRGADPRTSFLFIQRESRCAIRTAALLASWLRHCSGGSRQ
jgi:hypothetical protein